MDGAKVWPGGAGGFLLHVPGLRALSHQHRLWDESGAGLEGLHLPSLLYPHRVPGIPGSGPGGAVHPAALGRLPGIHWGFPLLVGQQDTAGPHAAVGLPPVRLLHYLLVRAPGSGAKHHQILFHPVLRGSVRGQLLLQLCSAFRGNTVVEPVQEERLGARPGRGVGPGGGVPAEYPGICGSL